MSKLYSLANNEVLNFAYTRGAGGVMVIIIGNGYSISSSNPGL